MSDALNDFQRATANWRATLARNTWRTRLVMLTFILIYIAIGLLIDVYRLTDVYPHAGLGQIFSALITGQLFPWVTLITAGIAVISLWVTIVWHDRLMLLGTEYHEILPNKTTNLQEQQLYNVVEEMKVAAGLRYMPKVYIIEADYMNAFASGYSEKSAMVAITRGLLQKLDRDELQAVMAHELSHIRHGDIKLTLMASVLSNLLLMLIDVLFWSALFGRNDRNNGSRNQLFIIIILLRYLLPLVTVLLMLYLSRTREYMADAGAVELMRDNEPMARALLKIRDDHQANRENYSQAYSQTAHESVRRQAYIFDPVQAGVEPVKSMSDALSTHPNIAHRLKALGFLAKKS